MSDDNVRAAEALYKTVGTATDALAGARAAVAIVTTLPITGLALSVVAQAALVVSTILGGKEGYKNPLDGIPRLACLRFF